jgi:hypothetical protein
MKTNTLSQTSMVAEVTSTNVPVSQAQPWYVVRPALFFTLAILIGVLGVITLCPVLVDHTLMAVL